MHDQVIGSDLAEIAAASAQTPFDAVVVGAGSAGLTAAQTLAEHGKTVALVEAGPAPFLTHLANTEVRFSRSLVRAVREKVQYSPALATGGVFGKNFSCLGGRGLFWNGSAPRFQAFDFQGWSIESAELLPHYRWAERSFRVTGQLGTTPLAARLIARLVHAGFDARPGPFAVDLASLGDGHLSAGIASGLAPFFRGAANQLISGQIRLAINSQALRISTGRSGATGVVVSQRADEPVEVRSNCVVLAAGGIESIRLAALSDIPDPHGRIGVGIQDHIFYRCYFAGHHVYTPGRRETATLHVPASTQTTEQWELQAPGRLLWGMDEEFEWDPRDDPMYELMIRAFGATEKRDDNRVVSDDGPLGSATVEFEYSSADRALMDRMRERAVAVGDAMGLVLSAERLFPPGSSYHEAGGLDMGDDPTTSVTNAVGRFHSMENVLCVDASAFPRIGAANPHITIVAESRRKATALAKTL
jgi:hypothetical protein